MIIAFTGKKGSGKDLCANYLVNKYNFVKKTFAEPLKKAGQVLFLLNDEQLNGTQEVKELPDPKWYNASSRQILQFLGTDLLRNQLNNIMPGINEDYFVKYFEIWHKNNNKINIVISDLRFLNESNYIKNNNGYIIKINRSSMYDDYHISENEFKDIKEDFIIDNNDTIEKLYQDVDNIIKKLI